MKETCIPVFNAISCRRWLIVSNKQLDSRELAGPAAGTVEGWTEYKTLDGRAVNRLDDEVFEVVATGERLSTKRPPGNLEQEVDGPRREITGRPLDFVLREVIITLTTGQTRRS